MKQCLKQHEVNNSKEQKSRYTTALFHYTKISVECNKKTLPLPHETTSETTRSQQQ